MCVVGHQPHSGIQLEENLDIAVMHPCDPNPGRGRLASFKPASFSFSDPDLKNRMECDVQMTAEGGLFSVSVSD